MPYVCVDHPAICCQDVAAQARWYCQHLGMKLLFSDQKTPATVLLGYGDAIGAGPMIELMPVRDPGPDPQSFARLQPGLRHLALRVSDFDEAYRRLRDLNVKFLFEPTVAVGGGRVVSFRDPEGNELQIVQRNEKSQ
jgi:catechol 2,3-dioxygenase-like lactoylglutathione lyase family enzyme